MTKTPKTTAITIQEEPGRLLSAGTRGSPMVRHFPFAASKVVILADLCSRSKSARRFWPECLRLNAQSDPFPRVGTLWHAFARCTAQHQPAFGWDRHAICSFATVICAAATAAAHRTAGCAPGSMRTQCSLPSPSLAPITSTLCPRSRYACRVGPDVMSLGFLTGPTGVVLARLTARWSSRGIISVRVDQTDS